MNFWTQFPQPTCLPYDCQCEFVYDALIRQPSSFWSALAYIIFVIILYIQAPKKSLELKLWTEVSILIGLTSMFAHGSFIKFAMAMDFSTIILATSLFPILKRFEHLNLSLVKIYALFILYYVGLVVVFYSLEKWFKIALCLLIFFLSVTEQFGEIKKKGLLSSRDLNFFFIILLTSFGMFLLDEFHVYCDPHSLFQWHSLWHLGTAIALYYFGRWKFLKAD